MKDSTSGKSMPSRSRHTHCVGCIAFVCPARDICASGASNSPLSRHALALAVLVTRSYSSVIFDTVVCSLLKWYTFGYEDEADLHKGVRSLALSVFTMNELTNSSVLLGDFGVTILLLLDKVNFGE